MLVLTISSPSRATSMLLDGIRVSLAKEMDHNQSGSLLDAQVSADRTRSEFQLGSPSTSPGGPDCPSIQRHMLRKLMPGRGGPGLIPSDNGSTYSESASSNTSSQSLHSSLKSIASRAVAGTLWVAEKILLQV
jgi:hypothetical protein